MKDKPAFPYAVPISSSRAKYVDGMTLREWYAGMAVMQIPPNVKWIIGPDTEKIAKYAFEIADAMISQTNDSQDDK